MKDIELDGKVLDKIDSIKVLGMIISSKLTWNEHIDYITAKANKRLYFLALLLRAGTSTRDVLEVYFSIVRSVVEYAVEV